MLRPPATPRQETSHALRPPASVPPAWVTGALVAANMLIWLAMLVKGAGVGRTPDSMLFAWGGNSARAVQQGEWWRLATALFLHGGAVHLLVSLIGLSAAGLLVERAYGGAAMVLVYAGGGLVGHALCLHDGSHGGVAVGASAAIAGLSGAAVLSLALQWRRAESVFVNAVPLRRLDRVAWVAVAAWTVHAAIPAGQAGPAQHMLAPASMLGGALAGGVLGMFLLPASETPNSGRGTAIALAVACASVITIASMAPKVAPAVSAEVPDPGAAVGATRLLQP